MSRHVYTEARPRCRSTTLLGWRCHFYASHYGLCALHAGLKDRQPFKALSEGESAEFVGGGC